ncbi:uncharacterized protein LOC114750225 [Neltuma alba]|uniref:uncharacterized protein LOC114750225 n=1 Tax=Neltuma alba TaxID=207710 RepID=UPI0010A45A4A|nr:uncharacterized protein LOC114750225 [Prosopis alba]
MFRVRGSWARFSEPFKFLRTASFSSNAKNSSNNSTKNDMIIRDERYRQLENLDFMTAAKMLFTDPPKKKKFGLDFHLVQLFFACLPSLAVYLVAQYARYDMKIMEAEVEQKRKLRDEKEAKEREELEKLKPPDPPLQEVKIRLDKLEEAVKEIVAETNKQSSSNLPQNHVKDGEKKHAKSSSTESDKNIALPPDKAVEKDNLGKPVKPNPESGQDSPKNKMAAPKSSLGDQKSQGKGGGGSD